MYKKYSFLIENKTKTNHINKDSEYPFTERCHKGEMNLAFFFLEILISDSEIYLKISK